jgi:hypothetical protein
MHILFVAFIFTLVVFVQASDHFPHPCHETHLGKHGFLVLKLLII